MQARATVPEHSQSGAWAHLAGCTCKGVTSAFSNRARQAWSTRITLWALTDACWRDLCPQIMSGEEVYVDPHSSLLTPAERAAEDREAAAEEGAMALVRQATERIVMTPDPTNVLPVLMSQGGS